MTMHKSGCLDLLADQLLVIPNGDAKAVECVFSFHVAIMYLEA